MLILFHAVSKSLLFLTVGAVENATGSRNIEDMTGLVVRLPKLAAAMIIGITTFCFSFVGVKVGNLFGVKYKSKAEFIGGFILIMLGVKILLEHFGVL